MIKQFIQILETAKKDAEFNKKKRDQMYDPNLNILDPLPKYKGDFFDKNKQITNIKINKN